MSTELWFRQPRTYLQLALEAGARRFTWHVGNALQGRREILGWMRSTTAGWGDIQIMIIDETGASEYSVFSDYLKPKAVYPTWAVGTDKISDLIDMLENDIATDPEHIFSDKLSPDVKPVFGQKHRVVVTNLGPAGPDRMSLLLRMRDIQATRPGEIFISDQLDYNSLFGMGFKAGDIRPGNVAETGAAFRRVALPSGKALVEDRVFDRRYSDWFHMLGWDQTDLVERDDFTRYNIESALWAAKHFDLATPFVRRSVQSVGKRKVFMRPDFIETPDTEFRLPRARRNLLRNMNIKGELDQFTCDTCILHNACSLSRTGSVCGVKGTEGMGLADNFGTRNAQAIITGLDGLLKKQVERVEDRMEAEAAADELDPEVTKEINSIMSNGVKLAKLLDPALTGGPKVQVNVGVGAGGAAQVAVAAADPKQMVASIVRELEASGIPREKITNTMIQGVLTGMASKGQAALEATKVANDGKTIPGEVK